MPLSDRVEIAGVFNHITEVFFSPFVLKSGSVRKIVDMMVLNLSATKKLEQTPLGSVHRHTIVRESVRNHNEVEMSRF